LRQPGVHDILDEEDVQARERYRRVLEEADARMSAGVGSVVARQLDEVDLVRDRDRAREIRQEDEARLQEGDQEQLAALVVLGDLRAQLGDAFSQLLGAEEDLSGSRVARLYDATSSR
jgi:hypothetical protein